MRCKNGKATLAVETESVLAAWWSIDNNLDCWHHFITCAELMESEA